MGPGLQARLVNLPEAEVPAGEQTRNPHGSLAKVTSCQLPASFLVGSHTLITECLRRENHAQSRMKRSGHWGFTTGPPPLVTVWVAPIQDGPQPVPRALMALHTWF